MPVRSPFVPYPDTTIEQWRELPELLDEHDQITSRYGTTGVRSQGKPIIVDTGLRAHDGTLMSELSTPGHTPGRISIIIASGGRRSYILGVVAHNPAQAHYTDWCPIFDIQPDVSRTTRHSVMDTLENEQILASAGHFPDPGFGQFVAVVGRRFWRGI